MQSPNTPIKPEKQAKLGGKAANNNNNNTSEKNMDSIFSVLNEFEGWTSYSKTKKDGKPETKFTRYTIETKQNEVGLTSNHMKM